MRRADEGMGFLLRYENVAWYEDGAVRILDRRIYPVKKEFVVCKRHEEVAQAIADMVTQSGGPYTAAAMGMALAAYEAADLSGNALVEYMDKAAYTLSHARPTTVQKMEQVVGGAMAVVRRQAEAGCCGKELVADLQDYAFQYINNNYLKYEVIGGYLADLIPQGGTVMTQCFAETIIGTLIDPFTLVIIDWKMPGMDGVEATRRIDQTSFAAHHLCDSLHEYHRADFTNFQTYFRRHKRIGGPLQCLL